MAIFLSKGIITVDAQLLTRFLVMQMLNNDQTFNYDLILMTTRITERTPLVRMVLMVLLAVVLLPLQE